LLLFQVFVSKVRFVGRPGVADRADVVGLFCRVRPIDPHVSPARCPVASALLGKRLGPDYGSPWLDIPVVLSLAIHAASNIASPTADNSCKLTAEL
jgi:hypothetical protein